MPEFRASFNLLERLWLLILPLEMSVMVLAGRFSTQQPVDNLLRYAVVAVCLAGLEMQDEQHL